MQKLTPQFAYMKDISIQQRMKRIVIVAIVGFALQIFVSPILGWIVVLVAALMGLMKSRTNQPDIMASGDWESVTVEEVQKAEQMLGSTSDIKSEGGASCGFGCLITVLAIFVGAIVFSLVDGGQLDIVRPVMFGGSLAATIVADVLAFVLVMSMGGKASAWEPPNLRTKLEQMGEILSVASTNPQLEFQPNMQLAKTADGSVPVDIKLLVKIKDAPPNFVGIQVQVSFNQVQSQSLPYTYCVILAKSDFQLAERTGMIEVPPEGGFPVGLLGLFADENKKRESHFARFHGSLIELKQENEVDIAVVRQDTSEGQGYTTSPSQALEVFSDAYVLTKQMLGAKD